MFRGIIKLTSINLGTKVNSRTVFCNGDLTIEIKENHLDKSVTYITNKIVDTENKKCLKFDVNTKKKGTGTYSSSLKKCLENDKFFTIYVDKIFDGFTYKYELNHFDFEG